MPDYVLVKADDFAWPMFWLKFAAEHGETEGERGEAKAALLWLEAELFFAEWEAQKDRASA